MYHRQCVHEGRVFRAATRTTGIRFVSENGLKRPFPRTVGKCTLYAREKVEGTRHPSGLRTAQCSAENALFKPPRIERGGASREPPHDSAAMYAKNVFVPSFWIVFFFSTSGLLTHKIEHLSKFSKTVFSIKLSGANTSRNVFHALSTTKIDCKTQRLHTPILMSAVRLLPLLKNVFL